MTATPTSRHTATFPVFLAVLLAVAAPVYAQDAGGGEADDAIPSAVLTYADRGVELVREHRELLPEALFGAELEPYDYLATESDAVAELRLATDEAAIELRLDPDSAVMLHPAPPPAATPPGPAANPVLVIELLRGSLAFEAGPAVLLRVVLREGTAEAAGAAGAVGRGPLGGIRVEASSGRVVVRLPEVDAGRLFATAERWVVYDPERGTAENTAAAGGMGSWRALRLTLAGMEAGRTAASARPDAGAAARPGPAEADRVAAYEDARGAFDAAYADAIEAEPAILEWMRDSDAARSLSVDVATRLAPALEALEEARRAFEPLFFEQAARRSVVPDDILPRSVVEDRRIITERLHTTRHMMRLLRASGGPPATGGGAEDGTGGGAHDATGIPERGM